MNERKNPVAKQNPGQKLSVSGYTLLYTIVPMIPAQLCTEPKAANIFPTKYNINLYCIVYKGYLYNMLINSAQIPHIGPNVDR